ncbi:MAG: class I SAM-dependent methyltransferase [Burkholderiaceae bacterium]
MTDGIIGLHQWLDSPAGHYLLDWERQQMDREVGDIFGYHAIQLGWPELASLQANRMPHRWLAIQESQGSMPTASARSPGESGQAWTQANLMADFTALPFPANSLDLVVLPHTLEFSVDPHATLREVARVLVPEGKVLIFGFNPLSLWGLRQRSSQGLERMGWGQRFVPQAGELIGYWRLRDWLRLLGCEIESGYFGCHRPALNNQKWLQRMRWMDRAGAQAWPFFGAVYFLTAVKRQRGMRILGPARKTAQSRAKINVPVANRSHDV